MMPSAWVVPDLLNIGCDTHGLVAISNAEVVQKTLSSSVLTGDRHSLHPAVYGKTWFFLVTA